MTDPEFLAAEFDRCADVITARWSIMLENHTEQVWAALTRPDQLCQWLAPGSIEPVVGGGARLDFADSGAVIDSRVTACEPDRLLEYSWSGPGEPPRPIRWTLEPIGAGTRLTLTLGVPISENAARAAAGWSAHLDMLQSLLIGVPTKFPFLAFKAAQAGYAEQLLAIA
jgi:uncharacterized protein YndB with AHSA1/START domain